MTALNAKQEAIKKASGIENNNGWIRIESEADLPKEGMHHSILLDSECINGYRNYDIIVFYEVNSRYRKKLHLFNLCCEVC